MMRNLLIALALVFVATPADAQRNRNNAAAPPACMSAGVRINCETGEPMSEEQIQAEQMTMQEAITASRSPTPWSNSPPLNITRMTIQEFNDSRVRGLHENVTRLLRDAVSAARRPFHPGRNQNLTDEIQVRLDPLADTTRPDRDRNCSNPSVRSGQIDYYWMIYYHDRTQVFVKPMCNLHILTYTILYNPPNG